MLVLYSIFKLDLRIIRREEQKIKDALIGLNGDKKYFLDLRYLNIVHEINRKTGKTQIVILGGGFARVETARHLDRTAAKRAYVEVTLVSRITSLSLRRC
jgi:hypothetical protein